MFWFHSTYACVAPKCHPTKMSSLFGGLLTYSRYWASVACSHSLRLCKIVSWYGPEGAYKNKGGLAFGIAVRNFHSPRRINEYFFYISRSEGKILFIFFLSEKPQSKTFWLWTNVLTSELLLRILRALWYWWIITSIDQNKRQVYFLWLSIV